jgi:hypothetical protein
MSESENRAAPAGEVQELAAKIIKEWVKSRIYPDTEPMSHEQLKERIAQTLADVRVAAKREAVERVGRSLNALANDWEALAAPGGNISGPCKKCLKQCAKELRAALRQSAGEQK